MGSRPYALSVDCTARKITSSRISSLPLWPHRADAVCECLYDRKFHDGYTDSSSHITFAQRDNQAYCVFREGESHLRQLLRHLSWSSWGTLCDGFGGQACASAA